MHDNSNKLEYGYSLYVRRSPRKDKQVKALMKIRSCIQEPASLKSDTFLKQILTCKRSIKRSQRQTHSAYLNRCKSFLYSPGFLILPPRHHKIK